MSLEFHFDAPLGHKFMLVVISIFSNSKNVEFQPYEWMIQNFKGSLCTWTFNFAHLRPIFDLFLKDLDGIYSYFQILKNEKEDKHQFVA